MSDEVTVYVGRDGMDSLEATASTLETTVEDSLGVVVDNRGTPVHVHCRLAGDLAEIAALEQSNYYVEADNEAFVPIHVETVSLDRDIEGTLEISTGYGANAVTIDARVTTGPAPVDVDETFASPKRTESEPTLLESAASLIRVEPGSLAVLALGVVALAVAVATTAVVGGPAAVAGVGAVGIGVIVALWLLYSG
ncbi:DUF7524 family protein [Natronoglomus mannanivorans]|uniref:Uncharacterized protein n=1 Tax=Natronoglomus mannanivorans TaxID=2979990 RepID=A0AAP2YWX4_9EURY|nr:hypothetical protein [Halobacteria archaeon AArc-xg1-1]